ncbi:hypothetical protein JZ751_016552, partial [Albula glossodonta]
MHAKARLWLTPMKCVLPHALSQRIRNPVRFKMAHLECHPDNTYALRRKFPHGKHLETDRHVYRRHQGVSIAMELTGQTDNGTSGQDSHDVPSDEFDCPICHDVLKTPIRTRACRHVFCRSCFEAAVQAGGPQCPLCRGPVSERERKAQDVQQQMRARRGPCRACGSLGNWSLSQHAMGKGQGAILGSLLSKMRTHYKYCQAYIDEYGPPPDSRILLGVHNGGGGRALTPAPSRTLPGVGAPPLSSLTGSLGAVYCCPYCQQQGLSDMALVQHCILLHARAHTPAVLEGYNACWFCFLSYFTTSSEQRNQVCPICASTSWGDPSYFSRNLIGHFRARHRYSYDIYM